MFNQVAVPEADQVSLRFLWRQSPNAVIEVYQFVRHIFGAKCAPTCSNYALLRSADNEMEFPIAALEVKRNFYMDDFFKSVKSTDEAMEMQQQLVEMLKLGGFHLTKWISNEKEVIAQIPQPQRAPSVKVVDENMPVERALGVIWDTNSDCLVYEVVKRNIANTRRKMLSLIASLFNPIGFVHVAPFLVRAKIVLQHVWHWLG